MRKIFLINESFLPLYEGFEFINGEYVFNPKSKQNINTTLGKKIFSPRTTKLGNLIIYSAYSKGRGDEVRNLLNALKSKSESVNKKSYVWFINRTALFFYHLLKNESFDLILTIESSSGISRDLKLAILDRLPYKPIVFDEGIKKNLNQAEYSIEENKLSDRTVKSLIKNIERQIKNGYFKIQKIPAQFRKFVRNWLKIDDRIRDKIDGSTILLIDDFSTTGSTMLEAGKLLEEFGAKKIIAITLIK